MSVAAAPNPTYAFVTAFFEELARAGVEHVCVSPGSRSTPLAVAAHQQPGLRAWSHLDERSAGFFALGLAKASRKPVALVATSGTAVANYLPAVVEAHYARVALIVLSADRPPELREWGAGQTIDQLEIFGSCVRYFAELPVPESSAQLLRYARTLACRAVAESQGACAGPVHLNWPLREPLAPIESSSPDAPVDTLALEGRSARQAEGDVVAPYTVTARGRVEPSPEQLEPWVERTLGHPRGMIACGPDDRSPALANAVARLARLAGWPVFAEPTSQLRAGPHVEGAPILSTGDLLLRDADFAANHPPDVVLRIGNTPVSKAFRLWLEARPPEHLLLLDSAGGWNEPSHLTSERLSVDPAAFCEALSEALVACSGGSEAARESDWRDSFMRAERLATRRLDACLDRESALFEPRAVRELCGVLPEGALLYVSNSMPIRDLDAFMPVCERRIRVLSNRGANGIDGMVSSALGASVGSDAPVVLLTGDLAFLHDLGGLLATRRHELSATIVILQNDGGGIFDHLPVARFGDSVGFEALFTTPHGLDLSRAAALFELDHTRVSSWEAYRAALEKSLVSPGVSIVEVPIDRARNLEHFRSLVEEVGAAVSHAGAPT